MAIAAYILLFLITRLTNITDFPLFIDETTHIYLADITHSDDLLVGLRETHKQVFIWIVALFLPLFNDPILAGRTVSVLAGLVNAAICYRLTNLFYPKRHLGYLAAIFYLISPYAVLYDRMAMADSAQTALMGTILLASVQLWRHHSVRWALVTGLAMGLATFNKGYAMLFYPFPILLWLFLGRDINWRQIIKLLAISYAVALIAWLPLFNAGWDIYVRDLQEKSIANPEIETSFLVRLGEASSWLGAYLTWPLVGLLIFAAVMAVVKKDKAGLALVSLIIWYLLVMPLLFTEIRPRYLFPLIIPLSVMIAWGIYILVGLLSNLLTRLRPNMKSIASGPPAVYHIILISLLGVGAISFSYFIVVAPDEAPLPYADRIDFIIQSESPHNYQELAQYITELVDQHGGLTLLRHSLPTPLETILSVYLPDEVEAQINYLPIGSLDQVTHDSLNGYAAQTPTLTVEYELITANSPSPLTYSQLWQVASFSRPNYPSTIGMYQWLLPPDFALHWLEQGGNKSPRLVWYAIDAPITARNGQLIDWPQLVPNTPEAMLQALSAADVEYILATPDLVNHNADLFASFITTDGTTLTITKLPPGWRLAYAYPQPNCEWCLFQLRPPTQPTQVIYGEGIELEGYDVSETQLTPGQNLHVTLYWHNLIAASDSLVVFIHLLDKQGKLVSQVDEPPLHGQWPMNQWQPGDRLADRHALPIPHNLPGGDYSVIVGLYDPETGSRLTAESQHQVIKDNSTILTKVSVD